MTPKASLTEMNFSSSTLVLHKMSRDVLQQVFVRSPVANQLRLATGDQHLCRSGIAQEPQRAGCARVRSGLKNPDQIADIRSGQLHVSRQNIERGAERSNDIDRL